VGAPFLNLSPRWRDCSASRPGRFTHQGRFLRPSLIRGCVGLRGLLDALERRNSILLSTTNKIQRYTVFFVIVNALHVSGGFSAHNQELKNFTWQHRVCARLACCYR
jgi:hypothetical protein